MPASTVRLMQAAFRRRQCTALAPDKSWLHARASPPGSVRIHRPSVRPNLPLVFERRRVRPDRPSERFAGDRRLARNPAKRFGLLVVFRPDAQSHPHAASPTPSGKSREIGHPPKRRLPRSANRIGKTMAPPNLPIIARRFTPYPSSLRNRRINTGTHCDIILMQWPRKLVRSTHRFANCFRRARSRAMPDKALPLDSARRDVQPRRE